MNNIERLIAQRFDHLSGTFPSSIDINDSRLKAIINRIGDIRNKKVLEVGCGKGRISRIFKSMGADVYGIDLSEKLLQDAKTVRPHYFVKASAGQIPFKSGSFDVVVLLEVLEHIPQPTVVFEELSRVLKNDGLLIIVDRNKFSLNNRRFLVPNMVIKRYHELKNEWMYPRNFPFREIWFNPRYICKCFNRYFITAGYDYIISDGERKKWWHIIFEVIPQTRHFVLWHGRGKRDNSHTDMHGAPKTAMKEFGAGSLRVSEKVALRQSIPDKVCLQNPIKGIFSLRIDADEYDKSAFGAYRGLFKEYASAVTIFFNVNAFKEAFDEIKFCKDSGVDVQSHAFYHHVYNDYENNRYNIRKAKNYFEKIGIHTAGFAAPFGKWNWQLQRALEDEGYVYTSDFSYDYLSLPSFPSKDGRVSPVLEIPIFPVAPELFFQKGIKDAEIVISYYKRAIDSIADCNLPIIIYAHTSRQYNEVPYLLEEILKYAILEKRLTPKNMTDIAKIWNNKGSIGNEVIVRKPDSAYSGSKTKDALYDIIKSAIKDFVDFERVTPLEELQGPVSKRLLKKCLRAILN